MKCFENKDNQCTIKNDIVNEYIEKMIEADGIIIGSPTYFSNVSTEVKANEKSSGKITRAKEEKI